MERDRTNFRVGSYRVTDRIGSGGMGTVFRGVHERLGRTVALKRIRSDLERNTRRRVHFLFEARVAARITHQNVAQVYDILEGEDADWIVMEYVEGEPLSRRMDQGALAVDTVVALGLDLAEGLAAAHLQGIVHRDLKPDNVMLTPEGRAKILDFGVADLVEPLDDGVVPPQPSGLVGTPRAMSPEQVLDTSVDPRTDLFALGTLLYESLSGEPPFYRSGKLWTTLQRICSHQQEPLTGLVPEVPVALSQVVDRLLEKDPADRLQSAEELILELHRLRGDAPRAAKVLFVDDEPDVERLLELRYRAMIEAGELELLFARDGEQALEALQADPQIHLLITDLRMPGMDGLALLGELRRRSLSVLTIVVSAYGDLSNIRKAMNLGAFDFLLKPIDFDDLERTRLKALREVSKRRQLRWLRDENRLLDERHRWLRGAFSRHLRSSDPGGDDQPAAVDGSTLSWTSGATVRTRLTNSE
ncbi:MAG: protein kinase [Acidobacteriota bacterium]